MVGISWMTDTTDDILFNVFTLLNGKKAKSYLVG